MKKICICSLILIALLFSGKLSAQKTTTNLNQVWMGYFNQTRLTNKWGYWVDVNLRTKQDFIDSLSLGMVRVGVTYYVSNTTKLTAGYARVNFFPGDNHQQISQPENRLWQQVQWHTNYGKKRMMQWIRMDERFVHKVLNNQELANGYNFNFKLRYNIWYEVPLSKKGIVPGAVSFVVNDEVHVNFGKQIVNNYFDQNRFFVGLKLQTSKQSNVQLGYLNVFQQLAAGNRYKNIDAIRLFYFQNIDLRRAK